MKAQYDNKVTSSFYLWFDHTLMDRGEAFTNFESKLYDVDDRFYGFYTYGSPFKQFVSDFSISGANIITGVYVDGSFVENGADGLTGINYSMGQVYFNSSKDSSEVSGDYAVKDFNVFLTNETEETLLFETQFTIANETNITQTGLGPNVKTYPAIFLKNMGGKNEPFQFGGTDMTSIEVRAIVLSDSQFKLDAVCSIFKDQSRSYVPILTEAEQPFNGLGDYNSSNYNYKTLTAGKIGTDNDIFIKNVFVSKMGGAELSQIDNLNPDVFSAIIDFELEKPRLPQR